MEQRNYPAGWNDPPALGYTPAKPASNVRNLLNKRIAFPVSGTATAGGSDNNITAANAVAYQHQHSASYGDQQDKICVNQFLLEKPLDISAYPNYPADNGVLHNPAVPAINADHFNRSASSPCFSQPFELPAGSASLYTSPAVAVPPYSNQLYSLPAVIPARLHPAPDVQTSAVPQYSNFEIISVLQGASAGCVNMAKSTKDNVDRRIAALKISLDTNCLSDKCRSRLCNLVYDLTNRRFNDAYSTHSAMMIEHYAEVNSWMIGVKAIIMEYLKH